MEMKTVDELARMVVKMSLDADNKERAMVNVSSSIGWYLDDIFKLYENINETSVNWEDRVKRIYEMEEKFGIPKTHILSARNPKNERLKQAETYIRNVVDGVEKGGKLTANGQKFLDELKTFLNDK
jgi:hypothetical protein